MITGVGARLLRGGGLLAYSRAAVMAGQILTVPILVTRWGAVGYGEWLSLTAVTSYLSYSGLGVAPAAGAEMAMNYARAGEDATRPVFQTALLLISALSVGAGVLLMSANAMTPFAGGLRLHFIGPAGATSILLAVTISAVVSLVNGVLTASIAAMGQYPLVNAINAVRQTGEFVALAGFVGLLRFPPSQSVWIYPLSASLTGIVALAIIGRRAPTLLTRWAPHPGVLGQLWRPMLGAVMLSFGYNGLMVQAPRVLLAVTAGPVAVAAYAVAVMLMRIARMPMEVPGVSVMTELAMAWGRGDMAVARRLLGLATRLTFWLSVLLLPALVFLGPLTVSIWSNGRLHLGRELIAILGLSTLAYGVSLSCQEALLAINRVAAASLMLIVLGLPFLGLCYVLSARFGVIGTGLAVSLFEASFAVWVVSRTMQTFGVDLHGVLRWLALPSPSLVGRQALLLAGRLRRPVAAP